MKAVCTLTLLILGLQAWAQSLGEIARKNREAKKADKAQGKVLTNDDISPLASKKMPPNLPGSLACGTDLKCFLKALDEAKLAWWIHDETAPEASVILTTSTTWWITRYAGGQPTVTFRVNEFNAAIDEESAKRSSSRRRQYMEDQAADFNRDFSTIVGKENTCTVPHKDLAKALNEPTVKLMILSLTVYHAEDCTGPFVDPGARR